MPGFLVQFYALVFLAYIVFSIIKITKDETKIVVPLRDLELPFLLPFPVRSSRSLHTHSRTTSPARSTIPRPRSASSSTRAPSSVISKPASSTSGASSRRSSSSSLWSRKPKPTAPGGPATLKQRESKQKSRPTSLRSLATSKYRGMHLHGLPSPSLHSGFHFAGSGQLPAN
ncbi:hypothetical protein PMIN07_004866 [Paraphaeosphaeria minitans]